jgi:probable HAF family extracellular repeat protein
MFVRLSILALFVTGLLARAASPYQITLISSSDTRVLAVQPNGLNNAGEVVGYVTPGGPETAFYFTGGTLSLIGGTLNTPATNSSSGGFAVNASGQIAGFGGTLPAALIFNPDGSYTKIGTLGGVTSTAIGINNLGQVVGTSTPSGAAVVGHAFLYTGGPLIDLGTFGGPGSTASSINDSEQVVGYAQTATGDNHAFLYSNGTLQDLTPGGGAAYSINDNGAVVGQADFTGDTGAHAFLYTNGITQDLGTLGGPYSSAASINANGDIVGTSGLSDLTARAFLYRDGVMVDLNSMIDPASGWFLETASGINDAGQITGTGVYNGEQVGYLLTPLVDTAPPSISLVNVVLRPPEQAIFSVVDPSGLLTVSATASNAMVTVTPFLPGQTTPVTVTATKTDQSAGATVTVYAEDVAGNQASLDPAFVTVYGSGGPVAAPLSDVPSGEHVLTVTNGSPGLNELRILVNQTTVALPLKEGEARSLNLRAWMTFTSNSISFKGDGAANASASVVLRDATARSSRVRARLPE